MFIFYFSKESQARLSLPMSLFVFTSFLIYVRWYTWFSASVSLQKELCNLLAYQSMRKWVWISKKHIKIGVLYTTVILVPGEVETRGSLKFIGHPSFPNWWTLRDPLLKSNVIEEDMQYWPLGFCTWKLIFMLMNCCIACATYIK